MFALTGLGAAVAGILVYPQPLFPYAVAYGRLELYSDRRFEPAIGRALLAEADGRLRRSPLDRGDGVHRVFVGGARWRHLLTFLWNAGVGGVNYYPLTRNVFLREADIEADRIISPLGSALAPPRTFVYFVVHEIAHSLTGERIGAPAYARLPFWIREGVADYIAVAGGDDDLDEMTRTFREGEHPAFDYRRSGLYTRYRFLVAYLVERRHLPIQSLLDRPMLQSDAEALVRASLADAP